MAERIKKGFFKVLPWSVVMLMIVSISLGVWYSLPVNPAKAAAINTATKIDVTPATQFTTSKGTPVYRLVITNSGADADTLTTLAPTPSGTVVDTKATLHFFNDVNQNGIADQGDTDLGASAAFAVDNTKQTFNITDVAVGAGTSVQILITVDMLAETNANTFTLGFATSPDIGLTVGALGAFPINNANALTISNAAPAVTVANGAAKPAAKTVKASATNVAVHQLLITAAAGTSDSIRSLAPTPAGTAADNTDITSVVFYIDSGSTAGAVDGTDVQLATDVSVYSADNTKTTFTFTSPVPVVAAGSVNILVVYNMGALVGQDTKTFTADIAAAGDAITGSGTAVTESSTISAALTIDITAATITSAQTLDNDSDGHIDRITVVYSEAVNDADYNAFAATGYSVVVGTSSGTGGATLIYQLTELGSYDTGATPVLTWTAANAQDLAGNNLDLTGAPAAATDKALPIALSAAYKDTNADGRVNRVDVTFSETMALTEYEALDWTFPTPGSVIALAAETAGAASTTTIQLTALGAVNKTGGGTTPTVTYTDQGTANSVKDAATVPNVAAGFVALNIDDGAAPVILTTSPANNATDVAMDANVVITFSEDMTNTEPAFSGMITRAPNFTLGTAAWTGLTVVTYAHSSSSFGGSTIYTVTLAGTIASAAAGDPDLGTGPVANPFSFTTLLAGGGGGGASLPASITVTTPNGGETLTGGGSYNITWSATSTTDPVSIYYSTDSGINFLNTIATDETNDGSYTWTVPNVATSAAKVKVVSGSLNDISDSNFAITYSTSAVSTSTSTVVASPTSVTANGTSKSTVTVTVKDSSSNLLSGKVVTLASSRGTSDTVTTVTGTTGTNGVATFEVKSSTAGTSTYTATAAGVVLTQTASVSFAAPGTPGETPVSLSVGDLIKSSLSSSVYYYGSDGKRHVFPNEKTYKSWYVDFTGIKIISASQLQGITLGKNVTVRPGTVLVKIQTDPKVYAVEPGGLLRWVPTEARASTLYGSAWATKIIDVPVIFWVDYTFGTDITTDKHPTGALVQYTGSTEKYYIQGTEKRLISTAGFTANKFQLSNVLTVPTSITYTTGTALTTEETALSRIY